MIVPCGIQLEKDICIGRQLGDVQMFQTDSKEKEPACGFLH